jgi:hypothetical protein
MAVGRRRLPRKVASQKVHMDARAIWPRRHRRGPRGRDRGGECFWKQYHTSLHTRWDPALYDAIVELISDWKNEMRNREIVKILKRNVDVQSKSDTKSMFRYGQRLADLEAKYNTAGAKMTSAIAGRR